jgi:hypothetical protein
MANQIRERFPGLTQHLDLLDPSVPMEFQREVFGVVVLHRHATERDPTAGHFYTSDAGDGATLLQLTVVRSGFYDVHLYCETHQGIAVADPNVLAILVANAGNAQTQIILARFRFGAAGHLDPPGERVYIPGVYFRDDSVIVAFFNGSQAVGDYVVGSVLLIPL